MGIQLRHIGAVEPGAKGDRPRMWPGGTQIRTYPLRMEFMESVLQGAEVQLNEGAETPTATAFCRGCASCPYLGTCKESAKRTQWEQEQSGGHRARFN